jgi:type I restriction enzyme S subunit
MDGRRVLHRTERGLSEKGANLVNSSQVPEGSVAVSCIGWQMGKAVLVTRPSFTNQQLNTVVPTGEVLPEFLYYHLCTRQAELKNLGSVGVRTPILNKSRFEELEIAVPPEAIQRRIVGLLSAYDDLIENNTKRIGILEAMARSLHREWFVDFRFPGHEQAKVVKGLPQGWTRRPLFDLATPTYGHPFKSSLFNDKGDGLPVVRIRNILDGKSETFTVEEAPADRRLKDGDVLIGMDGDFHMALWVGGDAWLNQRVVRIASNGELANYLLFWLLRDPIQHFNDTLVGTTVVHLGAKELRTIELLVPPDALLYQANEYFDTIGKLVVNLRLRCRELRATRDLLLPRLISGEIDVSSLPPDPAAS